jgi:hypothetical protein
MKDCLVDFDVPLYTYVLYYKEQKYPLNTLNYDRAHELGNLKLAFLKRQEAESYMN